MLGILDLFTPKSPIWSTNDLIKRLGTSRSTTYRYISCLHSAGLIGAVGNGYYVLGPRIVELDLQIRNCDPLHRAGKGILEQLVSATGHSALLCTLFSNSVLCIREHLAPLSPDHLFSRGQRRPLFFGAASKVMLPHLPVHQLRSMYARYAGTIEQANLGTNWKEFKSNLAKIRKDGFVMSHGEFNRGIVGIAAPIFNNQQLILGSIAVAFQESEYPYVDIPKTITAVMRSSREITQRIGSTMTGMALPPRAVG